MSDNYERRPTGEAARRSGQDSTSVPPPMLPGLEPEPVTEPWTATMHRQAAEARRRRDEGTQAALSAASASWVQDATWTIRQLAEKGQPFDAEDVVRYCGPPLGPSPNVIGALFSRASRAGIIRHHGFTVATRETSNQRALRTWVGTGRGRG